MTNLRDKEIYVVVAENDQPHTMSDGTVFIDDWGPLVFEQYVQFADLDNIRERAEELSLEYGKCHIAKLVFLEDENEST